MKNKAHLLPLASLLLAGGILCTGCGGDAPASSVPADVSTASSVEEGDAMDGYDYINDYVGLWGYYDIELWLRVHEDSTFEFVNSEDETIYTGTADAAGSFGQRRPVGGRLFGCFAPGGCHRLPGDLL